MRAAFHNLAVSLGLDFEEATLQIPGSSTLNESKFTVDCALMVMERERNASKAPQGRCEPERYR